MATAHTQRKSSGKQGLTYIFRMIWSLDMCRVFQRQEKSLESSKAPLFREKRISFTPNAASIYELRDAKPRS